MADARSLLRQQRAARRIVHVHAAYSDTGKLLCSLCHETVKAESLWEGHLRSSGHRERLPAAQLAHAPGMSNGDPAVNGRATDEAWHSHKRKHSRTEDADELDVEMEDDGVRKKRSRPDMASPTTAAAEPATKIRRDGAGAEGTAAAGHETERLTPLLHTPTATPPLTRRTSGAPAQGVEMNIPSRPATPNPFLRDGTTSSSGGQASAASTPKFTPVGRSPLIPQDATVGALPAPSVATSTAAMTTTITMTAATAADTATTSIPTTGPLPPRSQLQIDEAEWAAFEADVINAPAPASISANAVIAAAPMTADEVAAQADAEERARRRAMADVQMEDEKEEATRALEDEFDEMEELEARVRRLKEKREALRNRGGSTSAPSGTILGDRNRGNEAAALSKGEPAGKENREAGQDDEDDDDDDDDGDDGEDWTSFRFRT